GDAATWTYEELDSFIANPREHTPGTTMSFAGLRSAQDRADLLAYLQTLSADPVPFPEAEGGAEAAAAEGGEAAAADGDVAAADAPAEQAAAAAEDATPAQESAPADGEAPAAETAPTEEAAAAPAGDLDTLLANADLAAGDAVHAQCAAC